MMLFIKKGCDCPSTYYVVALANVCEEIDVVPTLTKATPTSIEVRVTGFPPNDVAELIEGLQARLPSVEVEEKKGYLTIHAH